jgi:hypothetical protein
MYKMVIDENDDLIDSKAFTAMLIDRQEYIDLHNDANLSTPPQDPEWLNNAGRRFFEAHRLFHLDNDHAEFHQFTDYRSDIRSCSWLFMVTTSIFPQRATGGNRTRD